MFGKKKMFETFRMVDEMRAMQLTLLRKWNSRISERIDTLADVAKECDLRLAAKIEENEYDVGSKLVELGEAVVCMGERLEGRIEELEEHVHNHCEDFEFIHRVLTSMKVDSECADPANGDVISWSHPPARVLEQLIDLLGYEVVLTEEPDEEGGYLPVVRTKRPVKKTAKK